MNPTTFLPVARHRRTAAIASGALSMVVFAAAAAPVAAAPALRAAVDDGTLRITGSPHSEQVALRLSALDRSRLQVDVGDDGSAEFSFDLGTFNGIDVATGNGRDTVRIDEVNGAFTTTEPTRIDGGNGADTLVGGGRAEVFVGGRGDDLVDGNGGADTAFLGNGDDAFVWDPGDASDVVEGGRGSDTLIFNGAGGPEIMAATADGGRVLFTRSPGSIVMDLDDVEVIDVRALGGTDTVTVDDLRGTDLERVDVDLAAAIGGSTGDGVADEVVVRGTNGDDAIAADADGAAVEVSGLTAFVRIPHADPGSDELIVDTLDGDDDVAVDPALAGLILVSVK